jgi:5'(3')-deoxyribonucleotidase
MNERLLLDMDGVTADFMGHVYNVVEQETGDKLCHADTVDYWFGDTEHKPLILDIMHRPGTFRNLDVITGAVRAVNRLREQYDVVVCTQPTTSTTCETEKREWLAEHFDADFAESAIVTRDKSKVLGKAIIEDNPNIDGQFIPIMFDQAWNRNRISKYRIFGWHDTKLIKRVMEL